MVVDRYCAEVIQAGTKVAKNDVRMSFKCHYAMILRKVLRKLLCKVCEGALQGRFA